MPIERFGQALGNRLNLLVHQNGASSRRSTLWPRSAIVLPDGICWNNYAARQSGDARRNSSAKLFKRRAAAILPECTTTWERVHLFPRCNLWWIRRISYSRGYLCAVWEPRRSNVTIITITMVTRAALYYYFQQICLASNPPIIRCLAYDVFHPFSWRSFLRAGCTKLLSNVEKMSIQYLLAFTVYIYIY